MASKTKNNKRKASPSQGHKPAPKAPRVTLAGPRPQLKDYTGDFSNTTFNQAKEYCKQLGLPGGYVANHQEFIRRLQDHYDGQKATAGTLKSDPSDPHVTAAGEVDAETANGEDLEKPIKGGKRTKGVDDAAKVQKPGKTANVAPTKNTAAAGGGSRVARPPAATTSRVLARGPHYRMFELKKMLDAVRNLARSEEDPALDPLLDLLREAYSAMNDVAPEPLSPDNPQSPLTPAGT